MQRAMENLAEAQSLAHVGNWEWDIPADKTTWSDEAYRVFGHEPQEFATSYERFTARVHPDDRAMVDEAIRLAVKEGKAYQIDHRVITPDGAERFVEERGQAFFDSSGKAIRLAGTVQDITERRAAEQALRETEERWNQFTESATESFILLDSDLNLIDINRRGARRFGFETAGEILGRNLVELSPVADQSGRIDLYRNVLSTGSPLHLEGVRIELEGGDRFMNYNVFAVGENLGFIVEDVTDRWAAEESLRKSEEMRRQFMDSATESFVLYDSNLNFLDINAVGLSGLNMNREDVIGKNLAVVVPATKESGRYEKYQSVLATGEPLLMEVVDVHPTRGELVKELKVFRVGDGLGMISQDVTERKAYEEDLRNERNFVASVLDTTGAIAIVVDREGRVVRFNFLANLDKVETIRSAYPDAAAVAA